MVADLTRFAEDRGLSPPVEQRLDRWVMGNGGRRTRVVDPWGWLARKLGRDRAPSQDVYEVPLEAIPSGAAVRPPR
jgi:hypothetical protein